MPDITLVCANCHNQFVYSEIEQRQNAKTNLPHPIYCLICRSLKQAQSKFPGKPQDLTKPQL